MDPILLYGFPMGSSMGLVAALEWLGRPYRLCRVDMLGEMLSPSYARINPRQETPALITDQGDVLTETMAIAAWLEARDTERRISFDPLSPQADRMHQLMAFVNTGFTGAFAPLWVAMEGVAMDDATRRGRLHGHIPASGAPAPRSGAPPILAATPQTTSRIFTYVRGAGASFGRCHCRKALA